MTELLEEARASVERLQTYDVARLERKDLGVFHLGGGLPPARRLQDFFSQIPLDQLQMLPDERLRHLRDGANAVFNIFDQIRAWNPIEDNNPKSTQSQLLEQLEGAYQTEFDRLAPLISFLATRERDLTAVEQRARAAAQAAEDRATVLEEQLAASAAEAKRMLDNIKATAAEQGVSQQAHHFAEEASAHDKAAATSLDTTRNWAVGLGVYALATLIVSYIPALSPETAYQAVQQSISKVLIFAVIAYMLFLSARTLLAHRHNAVVNKHRRNALLTFNALADGTMMLNAT